MSDTTSRLRLLAEDVVGPIPSGYLRPWMSAGDPAESQIFIVGANAATPFPANLVSRELYVNALITGGAAIREMYRRARGDRGPSPTRVNIDRLTSLLVQGGAPGVLETNVWAIPTKGIKELHQFHAGQRRASAEILPRLISILKPRIVIVHGSTATKGLAQSLHRQIAATTTDPLLSAGTPDIWAIPSLSPPAANRWLPGGWGNLGDLAKRIGPTGGQRANE